MNLTTAMLADGAQFVNGKLYILGGQWDRLAASQFPVRHPSMAVVVVLKVEYNEAPGDIELHIDLMMDGKPMGPQARARLSVGHAPGLKHGAPQFAPIAVTFNNVEFDKPGRYEWVVSSGKETLGQIPLEVVATMTVPAAPNASDE
ncbi:MAG TPA: hypothetical protein VFX25_05465 [Streptosporangiaceae bacterium]|nr:hypothetical protein [Streptosporangiaceae bacterium]